MNEQAIEDEIQQKNLNAPRITPEHIDSCVKEEKYVVIKNSLTTICQLTLQNGFTVIGTSDCVSAENYDVAIGEKIARENAREKIWELEGYLLKQRLHEMSLAYEVKKK